MGSAIVARLTSQSHSNLAAPVHPVKPVRAELPATVARLGPMAGAQCAPPGTDTDPRPNTAGSDAGVTGSSAEVLTDPAPNTAVRPQNQCLQKLHHLCIFCHPP